MRLRVVAHFFAGIRRHGDFHDIAAKKALELSIAVCIISVDIAIEGARNNLADPGNVKWWLQAIRVGVVLAAVSGPPCETWSAIRFVATDDPDGGPLPFVS